MEKYNIVGETSQEKDSKFIGVCLKDSDCLNLPESLTCYGKISLKKGRCMCVVVQKNKYVQCPTQNHGEGHKHLMALHRFEQLLRGEVPDPVATGDASTSMDTDDCIDMSNDDNFDEDEVDEDNELSEADTTTDDPRADPNMPHPSAVYSFNNDIFMTSPGDQPNNYPPPLSRDVANVNEQMERREIESLTETIAKLKMKEEAVKKELNDKSKVLNDLNKEIENKQAAAEFYTEQAGKAQAAMNAQDAELDEVGDALDSAITRNLCTNIYANMDAMANQLLTENPSLKYEYEKSIKERLVDGLWSRLKARENASRIRRGMPLNP
jgi:hypothetical protein